MVHFDLEDNGAEDARLVVYGVGDLGETVTRVLAQAEFEGELVHLTRSRVAPEEWKTLRIPRQRSESTSEQEFDTKEKVAPGSARALIFLVGVLDGTVSQALTGLGGRLAGESQAIIATVAFPPLHEGHSKRRAAISELEDLTTKNASVVVFESDQALRRLSPEDPIGLFQRKLADHIAEAVSGISDLVRVSGEVNVDLADLFMILRPGAVGFHAMAAASGEDRARIAAEMVLEEAAAGTVPISGAPGCLISITGGMDLAIDEVSRICAIIQEEAGDDAEIIFGAVHDPTFQGEVRVGTCWIGFQASPALFDPSAAFPRIPSSSHSTGDPLKHRPLSNSLRVFLASPSDVSGEREAAKRAVDELNLQHAGRWGTHLELIRWETHAVPAMGRAQEVVNEGTFLENIDILVGILWSRLGTPTGVASSGTVEEFEWAYDAWRIRGRPWIVFYFCDRPVQYKGVDGAEQYLKVAQFREQFPDKGLYSTYSSVDQFQQLLSRHLLRIVETLLERRHEEGGEDAATDSG